MIDKIDLINCLCFSYVIFNFCHCSLYLRLLAALEASEEGQLNVGDKSSPEDIWKILPGLSKAQYKAGIGALLRWDWLLKTIIRRIRLEEKTGKERRRKERRRPGRRQEERRREENTGEYWRREEMRGEENIGEDWGRDKKRGEERGREDETGGRGLRSGKERGM